MMAKGRRGANEGSIYKRASDGRWVGALVVGLDANGKPRRRIVYGATRAEAAEELQRLQAKRLDGSLGELVRVKLGAFLERWLEDTARPQLRATTFANYSGMIRNHVLPHLGGVSLTKLAPVHVQALLATLEREEASAHVREATYGALRRALEDAVRWGMIPRNPCAPVRRPRPPRAELRVLDTAQVRKLLEHARGDRLEALYVMAVMTGMRQGELLGLRWGDLDLRAATVNVQRTLVQVGGTLELGEVKTPRSRRRVDLPRVAVEALEAHRARLGAIPHPEVLVFVDEAGGPIRKSNLTRRSFRRLLERAKLPRIRFHDLRHSHATMLLAQGVHPKVAQERLGHAAISITLDTYSHVLEGMQREATEKLDALLG